MKKSTSIVPIDADPVQLATVMEREVQTRQVIMGYIKHHMKRGTDYGSIKIVNKNTGRETLTKPSLFKPGSEKFLSLFKLQARFKKDTDTWEMAGGYPGVFTYMCELFTLKGVKVGEGRGAARKDEKSSWNENNAIKIAQKRAQIDAVLRTGALSDFFTQDFEEEGDKLPKTYKVERVQEAADDEGQGKRAPTVIPPNTKIIKELLEDLGKTAKTPREMKMFVKMLTGGIKDGMEWKPGENDQDIIDSLKELKAEQPKL